MDKLKESEWVVISKLLLNLYSIDDIQMFVGKTLKLFRMLIPYTKGYFVLLDENNEINMHKSAFLGMEDKTFREYMGDYYEKDYIRYVFDLYQHTIAYRDTDILEDSPRKKTEFYREFLRPNNIPYGAGILLVKNGKVIGIISLFRSGELGDFTDKDMYIFDILKDHMANITERLKNQENVAVQAPFVNLEEIKKQYGLTGKEYEVALEILEGKSNQEIGEKLVISISTVKKHIYNIYGKVGVKNRSQFLALLNHTL